MNYRNNRVDKILELNVYLIVPDKNDTLFVTSHTEDHDSHGYLDHHILHNPHNNLLYGVIIISI